MILKMGKYINFIFNNKRNLFFYFKSNSAEWFKFDDATVSTISKTAIQSPYAYMLVYRLSV